MSAGVIIMTPIFMNSTTKAITKNKTDTLFAIAFTSFETQEVLRLAMQAYTISDFIDVFLFDADGTENNTFLAHYSNAEMPQYDNYTLSINLSEQTVRDSPADIIYSEELYTLNRKWKVLVIARPGFINSHRTTFPLRLLFIALIDPLVAR
ncbi:hypothetical protein HDU97_002039 [Phlyctochytrium planicorne]|nr:hypothetical protein HDU97_002039 [Phlyctochytrium planicorne]